MKRKRTAKPDYQSYLLRLWREDTHRPWHASLQSVTTEQTLHFATLQALFMFLEGHLGKEDDVAANDGTRRNADTEKEET